MMILHGQIGISKSMSQAEYIIVEQLQVIYIITIYYHCKLRMLLMLALKHTTCNESLVPLDAT